MSKETFILQKIDGIYDIQPLIEPAASFLETALFSLSLIFIIFFVLYYTWKILYSKRSIAKRKIKQLRDQYAKNKVNRHDTIYQLCFITKQGLNLKYINKNTLLPDKLTSKKQQWQSYIEDISILRYKKNSEPNVDINKLFSNSLFWLKVWP